jgi:hypothetical protein
VVQGARARFACELEFVDLAIGAAPFLVGREAFDALHQHTAIPGPIEQLFSRRYPTTLAQQYEHNRGVTNCSLDRGNRRMA